jgi:aldehyde:ferredoxin oxidoreductase
MKYGTCAVTGAYVVSGGSPVKNWLLSGEEAFPTYEQIADPEKLLHYQVKKYACANCPIACGGIIQVAEGKHPLKESHKPEYETIAAFGPMCANDDLVSIIKLNDMCNRSGLDTISAGSVLGFAMECYENGLITTADTDGLELTWGNPDAMISMLDKIIRREGLGDILADGVKLAAERLGQGAEAYAMHVGGQEPGMSNTLWQPSRATGFICDPTPGRHTAAPMCRIDAGISSIANYPEMQFPKFESHEYTGKGPASARISCYWQVAACAGVCYVPVIYMGNYPLLEFIASVTGWDMDIQEALETGARIQTLRKCFNVREGIKQSDIRLPLRLMGIPPRKEGLFAGITIDVDSLTSEYNREMGWDPKNGRPTDETLERLKLKSLFEAQQ